MKSEQDSSRTELIPRCPGARPRACLFAVFLGTTLLAGCQTARVQDPLTRTVGGNGDEDQLEFWHQLADRPVTSNDEAFHGLLLFANGTDPAADYPGRVAALKTRGMLSAGFGSPADEAIDRGTLAVAMAKALKIRGGLVMSVFGPSKRYAVRELQFLNLFPPSSQNQTFSGSEFLGILAKAEEYQNSPSRGSQSVDVVAEESGEPVTRPPAPATQKAPYPPIPATPEPPGGGR